MFGIVEFEWMIDARTIFHELDRSAGVRRDVADGEKAMWKLRTADDVFQPRRVFWSKEGLSVRDCDQPGSADRPVDTVHYY